MVKHLVGVRIVDHRVVAPPHLFPIDMQSTGGTRASRGLDPVRGIGSAMLLSSALWMLLLFAF